MIDETNFLSLLIDPSKRHNHLVLGLSFFKNKIKTFDALNTVKVEDISPIELMLLEQYLLVNAINILDLGSIGFFGKELMYVG